MRWELQKQEAADKQALSTIEKREQLERKLKEIREKRETVRSNQNEPGLFIGEKQDRRGSRDRENEESGCWGGERYGKWK